MSVLASLCFVEGHVLQQPSLKSGAVAWSWIVFHRHTILFEMGRVQQTAQFFCEMQIDREHDRVKAFFTVFTLEKPMKLTMKPLLEFLSCLEFAIVRNLSWV